MKKNMVLRDFYMILMLNFQSAQCQALAMCWGCSFEQKKINLFKIYSL